MNKVYFITGGGTGGHIYPAIAIADALLKEDNVKIFYVGNPNNLEATIVANKNYTFLPIISSGMPRKLSFKFFKWTFQIFSAWLKCCYYILKYKPNLIFGTGGYVSAPALFAAITTKTPFMLHDCDANPGLVTRKLAPFAKKVSVAFEIAKTKLNNNNIYINGNPIRNEFKILNKESARNNLNLENKLTICIMGGSQGAKSINNTTIKALKDLLANNDIQIIFQTGKKNYDECLNMLENVYPEYKSNKNLIIKPYFDDMVTVLKASDIAVSRAGSLSISELSACGIATIFVPYPYAAADHQRKNAKFMLNNCAGLYIEDNELTSEKLIFELSSLINNQEKRINIQKNVSNIAKFDAVKNIIEQIYSID